MNVASPPLPEVQFKVPVDYRKCQQAEFKCTNFTLLKYSMLIAMNSLRINIHWPQEQAVITTQNHKK